jgi:hypothetical protein
LGEGLWTREAVAAWAAHALAAARASRQNRCRISPPKPKRVLITFTATARPSRVSSAR